MNQGAGIIYTIFQQGMVVSVFHSAFECSYLWLPLAGFIIGMAASMTGSGGGFFFIPVLILFFHVPSHVTVATSLAATLPVCLVGSLGHYRQGHIDFRLWGLFSVSGIIGAVTGAGVTRMLSSGQLKTAFGIYAVLIAIPILISYGRERKVKKQGTEERKVSGAGNAFKGSFFGFLAGMTAGTFGTSGAAPVLAGLMAMQIPLKLIIGTSLLIVLINTFFALGAHFLVGEIDLTLVLFLAAGSAFGAFAGAKMLGRIRTNRAEASVRLWYAIAMIILGIVIIIT